MKTLNKAKDMLRIKVRQYSHLNEIGLAINSLKEMDFSMYKMKNSQKIEIIS